MNAKDLLSRVSRPLKATDTGVGASVEKEASAPVDQAKPYNGNPLSRVSQPLKAADPGVGASAEKNTSAPKDVKAKTYNGNPLSRVSQPLKAADPGVGTSTEKNEKNATVPKDVKVKTLDSETEIVAISGGDAITVQRVADCYANSLANDPTFQWLTGGNNPERVKSYLREYVHMSLRALPAAQQQGSASCWALQGSAASSQGTTTSSPEPLTKAVCLFYQHPCSAPSKWDLLRSGLLRVMRHLPSLRTVGYLLHMIPIFEDAKEEFFKEHGKFLYISCFGVAPEFRAETCASPLLQAVVAHAEAQGMPVYVEARSPDSRHWYEQEGFKVFQEAKYSAETPSQFVMVRLPTASAPAQ